MPSKYTSSTHLTIDRHNKRSERRQVPIASSDCRHRWRIASATTCGRQPAPPARPSRWAAGIPRMQRHLGVRTQLQRPHHERCQASRNSVTVDSPEPPRGWKSTMLNSETVRSFGNVLSVYVTRSTMTVKKILVGNHRAPRGPLLGTTAPRCTRRAHSNRFVRGR